MAVSRAGKYLRYAALITLLTILIQAASLYIATHGMRSAGFAMLCWFTVVGLVGVFTLGYAALKE